MAYDVTKTNGERLTIVPDRTVDTTTPLKLIGKNYAGYGEIMAENLVGLLENFSNVTPPSNAIEGQLWWDSQNKILKVRGSSSSWTPVGGLSRIKSVTDNNYTVTSEDNGVLLLMNSSVDRTVTLSADANIPVGTNLLISQHGAGKITVAGAVGVTVNSPSGNRTYQQYEKIYAVKTAENTWELDVRLAVINEQIIAPYQVAIGEEFDIFVIGGAPATQVSWTGSANGTATLNSMGGGGFFNLRLNSPGIYSWTFTFAATGHVRTVSVIVGDGVVAPTPGGFNELVTLTPSSITTNQPFTINITGAQPNSRVRYKISTSSTYSDWIPLNQIAGAGTHTQEIPAGIFTAPGTYIYNFQFEGSGNLRNASITVTAVGFNEILTALPTSITPSQSFVIKVSGAAPNSRVRYRISTNPTFGDWINLNQVNGPGTHEQTIPANTFSTPGQYSFIFQFEASGNLKTLTITVVSSPFNETVVFNPSTILSTQTFALRISGAQPNSRFQYKISTASTYSDWIPLNQANGPGTHQQTFPANLFTSSGTYTYNIRFEGTGNVKNASVAVTASGQNETVIASPSSITSNQPFNIVISGAASGSRFRYKLSTSSTYGDWINLNQINGPGTHQQAIPANTFTSPGAYTFNVQFEASNNVRNFTVNVSSASFNETVSFSPANINTNQTFNIVIAGAVPNSRVRYKLSTQADYGDWIQLNQVNGPGTHQQTIPANTFTSGGQYTFNFQFEATNNTRNQTINVASTGINEIVTFSPSSIEAHQQFTINITGAVPSSRVRFKLSSSLNYGDWIPLNQASGPGTHQQIIPGNTFVSPGDYSWDFEFEGSGNVKQTIITVTPYNETVTPTVNITPVDGFDINIDGAAPSTTFTYQVGSGAVSSPITVNNSGAYTQTLPGNIFTPGTYTITWTFTASGNTRTTTVNVAAVPTPAPTYNESVTSTVNIGVADGFDVTITGGAPNSTFTYQVDSGAVSSPISLDGSGAKTQSLPGNIFAPGTYTITWTFAASGNTRTTTVNVV